MIPKITTPVITRLILKTWEPYMIKYPSPLFDTNNSPIMTPIRDIEILIFKPLFFWHYFATVFVIALLYDINKELIGANDYV